MWLSEQNLEKVFEKKQAGKKLFIYFSLWKDVLLNFKKPVPHVQKLESTD
jgi:hypothetical protein